MNSASLGLRVAGTIFGLMCLAHLGRLVLQFQVELCGYEVPLWLNGLALVLTGLLSVWLWVLSFGPGPRRAPPPAT